MSENIIVRLRYIAEGRVDLAMEAIRDAFFGKDWPQHLANGYFTARCPGVDINPDQVSGYSTYETFTVAMFLEGNQKRNEQCLQMARTILEYQDAPQEEDVSPEVQLADHIKILVEEVYLMMDAEEKTNSFRTGLSYDTCTLRHSLVSAALDRVDWMELAQCYLNSAKEETPNE